jgi:very-short-patch-repair endonuclease
VTDSKLARAKQFRAQMTTEETVLWGRLRRNQLSGLHFRRQQPIAGFIVDFYCNAASLVVEIDGLIHETQQSYDDARDNVLESRGLRVVRIPAIQVRLEIDDVLAQIAAAAASPLPLREGAGG